MIGPEGHPASLRSLRPAPSASVVSMLDAIASFSWERVKQREANKSGVTTGVKRSERICASGDDAMQTKGRRAQLIRRFER